MPDPVRIGAVAYLNTRPLVFGMEQGLGAERIELSYGVPALLADRMQRNELDIALLPVIELASLPDLEIVPGLGIVTLGATRSVLLISRGDPREAATVALDPESRTSNALTRVLFAEHWGHSPTFLAGDDDLATTLENTDAAVRIGDKALFETAPPGTTVHDLGTVWTELTGLPFVFAAWIARRGIVDREIYRVLHDSRRRGSQVLDRIAEDYSWNGKRDPALARQYLSENIRFRLGAPEVEGLEQFFRLAAAHGVIDCAPELHFSFERVTECHTAATQGSAVSRLDGCENSDEVPHV